MAWLPTAISATDYEIARKAEFAAEQEVYIMTRGLVHELAVVESSADGSGTLTADDYNTIATVIAANKYTTAAGGEGENTVSGVSLVAAVKEEFSSTVLTAGSTVTCSFTTTIDTGGSTTASVVFKAPAWAANKVCDFQTGMAFDIVEASAKPIYTITTPVFTGTNSGTVRAKSKFGIFHVPAFTNFTKVGCTDNIEIVAPFRPIKEIPCGLDASGGGIKPGRTEVPTFSIRAKDVSFADGLSRSAGKYCNIAIRHYKESRLNCGYTVLGNAYFTIKPSAGEGDDPATVTAEGKYEYFFFFPAL